MQYPRDGGHFEKEGDAVLRSDSQIALKIPPRGVGELAAMPIEFTIIPAERLVITRSWGIVTFEEVVAHQNGLLADPKFNPDYDQLGIHTDAERFAATARQLTTIGGRRMFSDTSFRAHVASRDAVYGLLRMIACYDEFERKQESGRIFRDEESARQWLSQRRAERDAPRPE